MRRAIAIGTLLALLGGAPLFMASAGPTEKDKTGGGKWDPFANCKGPKISVTGPEAVSGAAIAGAVARWQEEASKKAGAAYGQWGHSGMRTLACQPRGGLGMQRRQVCTATALPCP